MVSLIRNTFQEKYFIHGGLNGHDCQRHAWAQVRAPWRSGRPAAGTRNYIRSRISPTTRRKLPVALLFTALFSIIGLSAESISIFNLWTGFTGVALGGVDTALDAISDGGTAAGNTLHTDKRDGCFTIGADLGFGDAPDLSLSAGFEALLSPEARVSFGTEKYQWKDVHVSAFLFPIMGGINRNIGEPGSVIRLSAYGGFGTMKGSCADYDDNSMSAPGMVWMESSGLSWKSAREYGSGFSDAISGTGMHRVIS